MTSNTLPVQCPVCIGAFGGACFRRSASPRDAEGFDCEACGRFEISRSAIPSLTGGELSTVTRAVFSHRLRLSQREDVPPMLNTDRIGALKEERLPTPSTQVTSLVRIFGESIRNKGQPFFLKQSTGPEVGVANQDSLYRLVEAAKLKGLVVDAGYRRYTSSNGGSVGAMSYDLTLDGWERYEAELRGLSSGSYGFMAMKFGDVTLDALVSNVMKPAISDQLKYELVDLRDVARAGVIDNIMRAQIRESAFVIVDLTHDNAGAYWEAGYAEGLGKPVIYICERQKFDTAKTHFDTNHCTTVIWDVGGADVFSKQLIATLKRSLNLFD
jgi:hypothetical protein